MKSLPLRYLAGYLVLIWCLSSCSHTAKTEAPHTLSSPTAEELILTAERVANWQLPRMDHLSYIRKNLFHSEKPREWVKATFLTGLAALAEESKNPIYEKWIQFKSEEWDWQLADRPYHADDHLIGQVYLWHFFRHGDSTILEPLKERFDYILANRPTSSLWFPTREERTDDNNCQERWCWADALYMAPATWFGLSKATGDPRYANFAHEEYKAVYDYLYDHEHHLFYRDSRYFERRGEYGEKVFWSRGVGWVFAGLARTIDVLPENHPETAFYLDLFQKMAAKIQSIQTKEGHWPMSLLAGDHAPHPETSGTAFFAYGFAWGMNKGLLPKESYMPTILKAWQSLESAIHPDGMLGWVQPIGAAPEDVQYTDTQLYGAGGFLLAATEMARLLR